MWWRLRSRSLVWDAIQRATPTSGVTARPLRVQGPDEAQALERQIGVDALDRLRMWDDELRESAGRNRRRLGAELAADPLDDPVDLAREPVDEPRLKAVHCGLADHRGRLGEVDPHQARGACEERVHRDLDPRRE